MIDQPLGVTVLGVLGIVGAIAIVVLAVGVALVVRHVRQFKRDMGQLWAMLKWVGKLFDHEPRTTSVADEPAVDDADVGAEHQTRDRPRDDERRRIGRSGLNGESFDDQRRPPP